MKKYFFVLTFIFSFFFLGVSTSLVSADYLPLKYEIKANDSYDNRKVDITISEYYNTLSALRITELDVCQAGEVGCEVYSRAKNNDIDFSEEPLKVVAQTIENVNYMELKGAPFTIEYEITTQRDGNIYFLIETYKYGGQLVDDDGGYAFAVYELSTLNQRIIINPDGRGEPSNTYDNVQFTSARNNTIDITLFENEYTQFTGVVYICEPGTGYKCIKYTIKDEPLSYAIRSYGDGEKELEFYLAKRDREIKDDTFSEDNSTKISKKIYLDTVGPKISIKGGQWIFVESGKRYQKQEASCVDAVFPTDRCEVINDLNIVRIDYTSDKYQLITYSATDRLGNISHEVVRVKVEILTNDNSGLVALVVSGIVAMVAFSILGVVVYKNHQKKKKLSYI